MVKNCNRIITVLLITISVLFLPGYASAAEQSKSAKVVLQLKWTHLFQFAGYYAALEKGYYRDAGLDVSFVEAGPDVNPVAEVLTGKANFGIGTSELLLNRVSGDKVVVLAAIFQHSPFAIMTLRDGPIQSVHDLAGRRIMIEPGAAELYAYLRKESVPRASLSITPHTHKVEDLLNRKVDAMSVYETEEPYTAGLAGAKVNIFSARSVGIDFYGDCLFTSQDYVANHPEVVRKFREASIRGWRYALANQGEMADLIRARYLPERSREQLVFEGQKIAQLVRDDLVEIGYMNPGRWQHIAETFAELGMIPPDASLKGFVYQPEPLPVSNKVIFAFGSISLLGLIAVFGLLRFILLNRRLERSEALYKSILAASPDGITVADLEGRILMASHKALTMFGFERDKDLIGQDSLVIIAPEDRERARANFGLMFQDVFTGPAEYLGIRVDGSFIDIEANAEIVRDANGSPRGLVMVARDIGARKRVEEKLLENSVFLDSLLNAIPAPVFYKDADGRYISVNKAFEVFYGQKKEGLTGKSVFDIAPSELAAAYHAKDLELLRQPGTQIYESQVKDARGIVHDVVFHKATFNGADGKIRGLVGAILDITDRKQAEEAMKSSRARYYALMDQSFEALALVDSQTKQVVEINRRFTELLGYSLPEDAPLYVEQYVKDSNSNMDKVYANLMQQRILPPESRIFIHKNGSEVAVDRAMTVISIDGRDHYLVSIRDMTAERSRQAELSHDVELARRVQRGLLPELTDSPFVSIRTIYQPLQFVSGDSYLMEWFNEGTLLRGFLFDVSGHGLATALQTASVSVLLREAMTTKLSLLDQVRRVNTRVSKYFTDEVFAAIIGFELDLYLMELRYVGAGITQFYANGRKILTPGMFVGAWADAEFLAGKVPITNGSTFHFLTDGYTDRLSQPENTDFWSLGGKDFDADVAALEKLAASGMLRDDATAVCLNVTAMPEGKGG